MTKTLADYRPQHDEDCLARVCTECSHPFHLGRCIFNVAVTNGVQSCPCQSVTTYSCSCGLDALLSGEGESRRENTKEDHSAGLIHQVASPLAESEPRPGCANTKTCREPCEDDDGCSYCTRCGLWEGAK